MHGGFTTCLQAALVATPDATVVGAKVEYDGSTCTKMAGNPSPDDLADCVDDEDYAVALLYTPGAGSGQDGASQLASPCSVILALGLLFGLRM